MPDTSLMANKSKLLNERSISCIGQFWMVARIPFPVCHGGTLVHCLITCLQQRGRLGQAPQQLQAYVHCRGEGRVLRVDLFIVS